MYARRVEARAPKSDAAEGISLREEQKRLTRRRLVSGALAAFERNGYSSTTIDDIAAAAQTGRATFYLHFKSRADLVLATVQAGATWWRGLFLEFAAAGPPTRETLNQWLDEMVDHYESQRIPLAVMEQAAAVEPEVDGLIRANTLESVAVIADTLRRWYGGDEADARIRASLLLMQMDHFYRLWKVHGVPYDRERSVAMLTDFWVLTMVPGERAGAVAKKPA